MKIEIKEPAGFRGDVMIREHPIGTIHRLNRIIAAGNKAEAFSIIESGKIVVDKKNLIMQAPNYGMDIIIQRLCSSNTYSLNIAYGEIGTGTTVCTITDTALTAPSVRVPVAVSQDQGNYQAVLQFFFPDGIITNQTYYEFGCFVDGSATIGTGQIFNHALFATGYAKSGGTDITVQVTFLISQ